MKIGIDARTLEGKKTGVGRYLSNLLKFWKNDDNEFVLYFKDEIPKDEICNDRSFRKKIIHNPLGFSSNFVFQHFLLPYQLKKDKMDFFFSPFYLKPIFCPVQNAIVLHDISCEAHPEWFDYKSQLILRAFSKYSARTTDKIFTVSNYSKGEIVKYYKINPEKIIVTNLSYDNSFTKNIDKNKVKEVKEKYNLDKFILCIGSIFNRRHVVEIIEAFEKILAKHKNYQLLIVGENYTHPFINIDEKIEKINEVFDRKVIIRLDFVNDEELQVFYNSCEINIYLSDYEGFGLPIVEAQFFGKPVITSYNSSLVEVGGSSVEFVKENSAEDIYKSVEKLISDEKYRIDLIGRGSENIKRFSWEKSARKTLKKILGKE